MADTKVSALVAAAAALATHEIPVNEALVSKKLTIALLREYILKRAAGPTTAAGEFMTWLVLAANAADITGVTQTTVMSITGVPAGRYHFRCQLIYQTTALTTGIDVSVHHTAGTAPVPWVTEHRFSGTGTANSTAAATQAAAGATGAIYESQGSRSVNALIGAGTISVDVINANLMSVIEGSFVSTLSGDLQIKMAAEAAGRIRRAMEGSFLELNRLS